MKRLVSLSMLFLVLFMTACAPGGNAKCSNGLCIKVKSIGPILKGESIPIEIKVKADKDSDVNISFGTDPGVTIEDVTDKTSMTHQDKVLVGWNKSVKAKVETTITQNVRFNETGNYTIYVVALLPDVVVKDAIHFIITESGGTEVPPGTIVTPINPAPVASPTPGPSPTFPPTDIPTPVLSATATEAPPTPTEVPSPTVTLPAYP